MIDSGSFYAPYHGHCVEDLAFVEAALRVDHPGGLVFLAGDSSLDNKYWFQTSAPAVNGYERILRPPRAKCDVIFSPRCDVAHHVNAELEARGLAMACVNTAVEATALNDRAFGRLLPQDEFIRDHLGPSDVVVFSVGGNDIAMAPLLCTCCSIVPLLLCTACCGDGNYGWPWCAAPPDVYTPTRGRCDCGCLGCGLPGCLAGCLACPPGFGYFVDLFGNRTSAYVANVVGRRRREQPRAVVVCMIYYLDVEGRGSWADAALAGLCYDSRPLLLQRAIAHVFDAATRRVRIDGVPVIPLPLFRVLDGSDTTDYVQRVEPSPTGGRKIARAIVDALPPLVVQTQPAPSRAGNTTATNHGAAHANNTSENPRHHHHHQGS